MTKPLPMAAAVLPLLAIVLFVSPMPLVSQLPGPDEVASGIAVRSLTAAQSVLGLDDRIHLVYELQVVNTSSLLITLNRVEALDAAGNKLDELADSALASRVVISGGETGPTFGPSHSGYILMDVTLPKSSVVPGLIRHRIVTTRQSRAAAGDDHQGAAALPSGFETGATFIAAETHVDRNPTFAIAPPLRGPGWLAGNGCCDEINPHRAAVIAINGSLFVPERFAIDFVQLDHENRPFSGPPDRLSSYAYFGVPVYSVADGIVLEAKDGAAEETPGALPARKTLETLAGNHVVVDIGDGHFVVYAHLQEHSLRVKPGDRVRRGDVLGLLGNTGNSSNPHLHFHIMDGPSALASNGLPFVIINFTSQGVVSALDSVFEGKPAVIDPKMAGSHRNSLPLNNHMVAFE